MKSSKSGLSNDDRIRNRDFPWLWAIRSYWTPGLDNVTVKSADNGDDLRKILSAPFSSGFGEVWVRHDTHYKERYRQLVKVERINIPIDAKERCLASWIVGTIPLGNKVLNLVFVLDPFGTTERFVIHRLKRGEYFGKMFVHAIHEYKSQTGNAAA